MKDGSNAFNTSKYYYYYNSPQNYRNLAYTASISLALSQGIDFQVPASRRFSVHNIEATI